MQAISLQLGKKIDLCNSHLWSVSYIMNILKAKTYTSWPSLGLSKLQAVSFQLGKKHSEKNYLLVLNTSTPIIAEWIYSS